MGVVHNEQMNLSCVYRRSLTNLDKAAELYLANN